MAEQNVTVGLKIVVRDEATRVLREMAGTSQSLAVLEERREQLARGTSAAYQDQAQNLAKVKPALTSAAAAAAPVAVPAGARSVESGRVASAGQAARQSSAEIAREMAEAVKPRSEAKADAGPPVGWLASFLEMLKSGFAGLLHRVGFADGGRVTGGTPGRDSVPASLMPGEFVLRESAARQLGYGPLQALNDGHTPFATGGPVAAACAPFASGRDTIRESVLERRTEFAGGGRVGAFVHRLEDRGKDIVNAGMSYLPRPIQSVINLGMKAAFASYTAGQALSEKVALHLGKTPEEAKSLRKYLTGADLLGVKGVTAGLTALGLGAAALPASFVPVGSSAYLIRHPLATAQVVMRGAADLAHRAGFEDGGAAGRDTVPAMLMPGEFVVNQAAARRIGHGVLERWNRGAGVQHFAAGGAVGGAGLASPLAPMPKATIGTTDVRIVGCAITVPVVVTNQGAAGGGPGGGGPGGGGPGGGVGIGMKMAGVYAAIRAAETGMQSYGKLADIAQNSMMTEAGRNRAMQESIPILGGIAKSFREMRENVDGTTEALRRNTFELGKFKEYHANEMQKESEHQETISQHRDLGARVKVNAANPFTMPKIPGDGDLMNERKMAAWRREIPLVQAETAAKRHHEVAREKIAVSRTEQKKIDKELAGHTIARDEALADLKKQVAKANNAPRTNFWADKDENKKGISNAQKAVEVANTQVEGDLLRLKREQTREMEAQTDRGKANQEIAAAQIGRDKERLTVLKEQEGMLRGQASAYGSLDEGQKMQAVQAAKQMKAHGFDSLSVEQHHALKAAGFGEQVGREEQKQAEKDPGIQVLRDAFGQKGNLKDSIKEVAKLESNIEVKIVQNNDHTDKIINDAFKKMEINLKKTIEQAAKARGVGIQIGEIIKHALGGG